MNKMLKKIAIFSVSNNAYSETFIQAHKNLLKGEMHFLYNSWIPIESAKYGSIIAYYKHFHRLMRYMKVLPVFIYDRIFKNLNSDKLKFYLKNEKIEIVLAEYGIAGAENIQILKDLNIPLIVHFHGFDATVYSIVKEYGDRYIEMFNYAKAIIVVSQSMKSKINKMGCPLNKLIVNPCAPNDDYFKIAPEFSKKQFIGIGRFVDKKAPYYTIFAFVEVLKKHPDAKLYLAGQGPLQETCKNIVKALSLTKNIVFLGVIQPTEYLKYLNESVAFVQHSITAENGDMEGTPVAVLEASAAGLPVISTLHAGIPDVIVNGVTGLLVEEHDVDGMAQNMIKVLDDLEYAKKLGAAGKIHVAQNFSMEKHISIIQKLIDN